MSLQNMGFKPSAGGPSAVADPHFSRDLDMQLALALSVGDGFLDQGGGRAVHAHPPAAADLRATSDFRAVRAIAAQPADAAGGIAPHIIEAATFRFRHAAPTTGGAAADDDELDDAADAPRGGAARACAVCLAALRGGDECRRLPCLHAFHVACVDGWLARSRLCPVCKADVAAAAIARV
jgi:hypothetical protein